MPAGLHVSLSYPHLGASPDGLINCDCCGESLIEIKCPYKYRELDPCTVTDRSFYLKFSDDGSLHLDKTHAYYHQVQGQLAISQRDYCDFVCWSLRGIHVERILKDTSYFASIKPHLDASFVKAILPLLLTGHSFAARDQASSSTARDPKVRTHASSSTNRSTTQDPKVRNRASSSTSRTTTQDPKVRTRASSSTSRTTTQDPKVCTRASSSTSCSAAGVRTTPTSSSDDSAQVYCFCQEEGSGWMVECDNTSWDKQWFHYECVGIK